MRATMTSILLASIASLICPSAWAQPAPGLLVGVAHGEDFKIRDLKLRRLSVPLTPGAQTSLPQAREAWIPRPGLDGGVWDPMAAVQWHVSLAPQPMIVIEGDPQLVGALERRLAGGTRTLLPFLDDRVVFGGGAQDGVSLPLEFP
jgi:hypothetical protein